MTDALSAQWQLAAGRRTLRATAVLSTLAFVGLALLAVSSDDFRASADGALSATLVGAGLAQVFVLVACTSAVTRDYGVGTTDLLCLAEPRRQRVFYARVATFGALSVLLGAVHVALGLLVATTSGGSLTAVSVAGLAPLLTVPLTYGTTAVLGVVVGELVRATVPAVAGALIWVLFVENSVSVLGAVGEQLQAWMPFVLQARFGGFAAEGGSSVQASAGAALLLLCLVVVWLGGRSADRRPL